MNTDALMKWRKWQDFPLVDSDLKEELKKIKDSDLEINDRFYKDLEFGTGGLRGVIGAGSNRMNVYTVGKATQGYANYLNKKYKAPSVSIAYDSRIKSDEFAKVTAEVFAANGISVNIYRELMPTPALSFAVRCLKCSGGVVITASHNPAQYNGYKVYGADGCQITTHAAKEILSEIDKIDIFNDVKKVSFNEALTTGLISYISDDIVTEFVNAVSNESLCDEKLNKNVSIVYTPLNGAGRYCVTRALKENGFTNIAVVKEQEMPDGNFTTCPYPNPEIREALTLGLDYAKRLDCDLLLATDPDCDRVGTAVKSNSEYVLLSGNEMGLLLFDYICKRRIALGKWPQHPILMKTIVTIDLVKQIALDYGVEVIEVLTGFKFIGEQIGKLETRGETNRFIFGFEESYGYLSGDYVRDKDGVGASLLICEMFAYYKSKGLSLLDVLGDLYKRYGYCLNTLRSYTFEGAEGFEKMSKIMESFRCSMPDRFGDRKIESVSDYKESLVRYSDGSHKNIELPKSDVLKINLEGNTSVVIRPSGTEPKLKMYLSVSAQNQIKAVEMEAELAHEMEKKLEI